jgi:hypothetical protein
VHSSKHKRLGICAAVFVCALVAACLAPGKTAGADSAELKPSAPARQSAPSPNYSVSAGFEGDIFPALANYLSFQNQAARTSGTVTVTVSNPGNKPLRERVTVQVPGWSDPEVRIVEVPAGKTRKVYFAPTFLPRLYVNHEIAAASARVTVSDIAGREKWATTVPVRLRSVDDMYWGKDFEYARFIASWVTPHDPEVEMILSRAKELMPGRRLPGYEASPRLQKKSTYLQLKAIYAAVQKQGLSYVKSSATLGTAANSDISERVRMPAESLRQVSANCIDGVVLYASLFENLGLDSAVVLVPGHAYVAVKLAQNSDRYLYLETALTGRASFEVAVRAAENGMRKRNPAEVITIPIQAARRAGIYPMPSPSRGDTGELLAGGGSKVAGN